MRAPRLRKEEREKIRALVEHEQMSLAIIRTEHAPPQLLPLFADLAKVCGMSIRRTLSSPLSDFGFAELDSDSKILIVLYMGGERTELINVSRTDPGALKELEESIHLSNFHSEVVRLGL